MLLRLCEHSHGTRPMSASLQRRGRRVELNSVRSKSCCPGGRQECYSNLPTRRAATCAGRRAEGDHRGSQTCSPQVVQHADRVHPLAGPLASTHYGSIRNHIRRQRARCGCVEQAHGPLPLAVLTTSNDHGGVRYDAQLQIDSVTIFQNSDRMLPTAALGTRADKSAAGNCIWKHTPLSHAIKDSEPALPEMTPLASQQRSTANDDIGWKSFRIPRQDMEGLLPGPRLGACTDGCAAHGSVQIHAECVGLAK
mmetsp:Transcript_159444/g.507542  ORF Transcript_159444/g.507542 Transcript_159444/m.507542 type:complete len:252 (-) Transcript_159444:13-768(-)